MKLAIVFVGMLLVVGCSSAEEPAQADACARDAVNDPPCKQETQRRNAYACPSQTAAFALISAKGYSDGGEPNCHASATIAGVVCCAN